jgi:hypothetical protein
MEVRSSRFAGVLARAPSSAPLGTITAWSASRLQGRNGGQPWGLALLHH